MPMHLRVQRGANAGAVFPLRPGPNTIGRSGENAIVLPDDKVSSRHARVDVDSTVCTVVDLGSTNGTLANGVVLDQPVQLQAGDLIHMGNTELVYDEGAVATEHATTNIRIVVDNDDTWPQLPVAWSPDETTQILPATAHGLEAGELRRLYGILSALYRVTGAVSRSTTLDELLANVLDVVFDIVPADHGSVLLVGGDGAELQPVVGRRRDAREQMIRVSETIVRVVTQGARGVLTRDAASDERFRRCDSIQRFGIHSALCVPIRTPRRLFGVIYLDTRSVTRQFTERDLELLTTVGSELGLAVENFRLIQANVEAERLAAIGQAVAGLSHYIRNILQGMEASRFLIPSAIEENDKAGFVEAWEAFDRNIQLISELVLNMLSYSKKAGPSYEPCDPNSVARQVADLVTRRAAERGDSLELRLDEAMPTLLLDRGAVHCALLNLLTNAIDATAQGTICIATRWVPESGRVEIAVNDTGPGVPPELHGRIFDAFFTTKGSKGTGLGLAVSKKVIEELSGRITVASAPGHGATFTLAVPAEPASGRGG